MHRFFALALFFALFFAGGKCSIGVSRGVGTASIFAAASPVS